MNAGRDQYDFVNLAVCVVCIHLIANGEFNDGTDAAETAVTGMQRLWGPRARYLLPDGTELGYSTSSCESCGDTHGDRYRAIAAIPTRGGETP
jgi:hypothetical protein